MKKYAFYCRILLYLSMGALVAIFWSVKVINPYMGNMDDVALGLMAEREGVMYHSSEFFNLKDFIDKALEGSAHSSRNSGYWAQAGITAHHLPTAITFIADFYKTLSDSDGPRSTFVIIGPDHLEKCDGFAAVTLKDYATPFGKSSINREITNSIIESGAMLDDDCFDGEHSIGAQVMFIKRVFPDADIVPILFSSKAQDALIADIVNLLSAHSKDITIVGSIDFSHYQSYENAKIVDSLTQQMIENMDVGSSTLENSDSPASLKAITLFSLQNGSVNPLILDRKNSFDFTGDSDTTTGYMNILFRNYEKTSGMADMIFVGDIMLSRSVGEKIKSSGDWRWPFLKIGEELAGADITFGNLETTVSDGGYNVGSVYSFRSDPRVMDGLVFAGFDVLSVANNHIGDWTRSAMEDTFSILKENGIEYVGGGFNKEEAHGAKIVEVEGMKIGFLGYTDLGARYTEAKKNISGIAWAGQDIVESDVAEALKISDFVIVSFHFGQEYKQLSNNRQKVLARAAIDAGSSLVIGHHPHVVQEIEEYGDGYIAYSLGNFVFDQTFSQETMEGMVLKVLVKDSDIVEIIPMKVDISSEFQPEFL